MHIPFCEELCPYCSFHRVVFREDLARAYFQALRKEIIMYKEKGYFFTALYVGGGTPTVLIDELARTLELIRESFPVAEISVETNPNHLTASNTKILKNTGVNRLSVGVQSFDDGLLQTVGRYHKYGSGKEITQRLRSTLGVFDTLNADMMFNFPSQTMAILERDLETLIDLGVDQVTYYPLMVAEYTEQIIREQLGMVDYHREKTFFQKITEMLADDYMASTAWCFSQQESMIDEYVINYEEYAGLGSGAFGYLDGSVLATTFDIGEYIRLVNEGRSPIFARKEFSVKEQMRYDLLMKLFGLRVDLAELGKKAHGHLYRFLLPELLFFRLVGGLKKEGTMLSLTPRGRYYWVIMMREFFIGVNNFRDFCRREPGLNQPDFVPMR
jgi:coproporphyrinogen III oxidase-like Fe-S oxidoreductase